MQTRFIECQDDQLSNHGKFFLMRFGQAECSYRSAVTNGPLLAALPIAKRFAGPLSTDSLFMLDLQTREGMIFNLADDMSLLRRTFLVHPLHVCILYFPLMAYLCQKRAEIWRLPKLITLPIESVFEQPGVLVDVLGQPVKGRHEWSRRLPLSARLRNRETPIDGDPEEGHDVITADEARESMSGAKPTWSANKP